MPRSCLRFSHIMLALFLLVTVAVTPSQAQTNVPPLQDKLVHLPNDVDDSTVSRYIVQLAGEPLVHIASQLARSSRTAELDYEQDAVQRHKNRLDSQRDVALQSFQREIGHAPQVKAVYNTAFNGVALELTAAEARRIAKLPNVVAIEQEQFYELTTDAGPGWIEATQVQDGSATGVYAATLLGSNLTPTVSSTLTGRAILTLNDSAMSLDYRVELSSQSLSAAIINSATKAQVAALTSSDGGKTYAGNVSLNAGQVALLTGDGLSVLVKTNAHPSGEIGGPISGYKGEGVVIGVIDSGINSRHPAFAEVGGDGYRHLNPLGQGTFVGACDPSNQYYSSYFQCNNKLIGAWTFEQTSVISNTAINEPSPEDENGHGSHTASTAAGNIQPSVTFEGMTLAVSGVAPHANIIAYDVCGFIDNGVFSNSCPTTTLLSAIDQAVKDKVDVINYSISGGSNPWNDSIELSFLNARKAGIVVSTSGGNSGPTASTAGHLGPWLLSSAATTHNRSFNKQLTQITASSGTLATITGVGLSAALPSDTELVYAGSAAIGNALCGTFTGPQAAQIAGKIVICDRGNYDRVVKAQNVLNAGGVGFILANDSGNGANLVTDPFPLPGMHITYNDGVTLKNWLVSATGTKTARITATTADINTSYADRIANFSSRGPASTNYANIIKPNIAAPGSNILAALQNDGGGSPNNGAASGTSMASPHTAGSAALLKGLHPDWTPGEIQSALMTTAYTTMFKEDGSTPAIPFDVGNGRVRVAKAALAGLVMDETYQRFVDANPSKGGDLTILNIPSMANTACIYTCSWSRTFRNTLNVPVTWTASYQEANLSASPASFTIPANGTQTVTFTFDTAGKTNNAYSFNRVTFTASGGLAPDVSMPVAVIPKISNLPKSYLYERNSNSITINETLRTIAYNSIALQKYSLQKGTVVEGTLAEGADHITSITVPANTQRLVVDVRSTTSVDLDLYVFRNGTLVCQSASVAILEYCSLNQPASNTYQILIHNYEASSSGGSDPFSYNYAIVPGSDDGSLSVNVPSTNSGGDITVTHGINVPSSQLGDSWYGIYSLTDSGTATLFGRNTIDFHHMLGALDQVQILGGNNQSTLVNTAFGTDLQVKLTDDAGNPLPNVTVTFSAPNSGASATFPSGNSAITDASGEASVAVKANTTAGSYSVTASATGANGLRSNVFNLTNLAGNVTTLAVTGGNNQSAEHNTNFASPLKVKATDQYGNPLSGLTVTFSAPSSGATVSFPSGASATTNASGEASVTAKANGVTGSYSVTATVTGASGPIQASFTLSNTQSQQLIYLPSLYKN